MKKITLFVLSLFVSFCGGNNSEESLKIAISIRHEETEVATKWSSYIIQEAKEEIRIAIPELDLRPLQRFEKYEKPIMDALYPKKMGYVVGGSGGTALDTNNRITSTGFKVKVLAVENTLDVIKDVLLKQGAPKETTLTYQGSIITLK